MKVSINGRLTAIAVGIILSASSCSIEKLVHASTEMTYARRKGPSYFDSNEKMLFGYNIGATFLYHLVQTRSSNSVYTQSEKAPEAEPNGLHLMSGLEFVAKGFREDYGADDKATTRFYYLKVPVDLVYHHYLNKGRLFGGLGPYFGYGVGGKQKFTFMNGIEEFPSFDKNNGYKRFDAGLNFLAGYDFDNGFGIGLGYDLGLTNIEDNGDDKTFNRAFSINIRYNIGNLFNK